MRLSDNIFLYTLTPLIILFIGALYVRFMVLQDYMVAYESECDPYTQVCFIGCEDDECTSEYYYSQMEKYAPNIFGQCGEDITDCDKAYICLPEDGEGCSVTFCDPEIDGDSCENLTEGDYVEEENVAEQEDITSDNDAGATMNDGLDSEDVLENEDVIIDDTAEIIENI